jgi:hypothetical protein
MVLKMAIDEYLGLKNDAEERNIVTARAGFDGFGPTRSGRVGAIPLSPPKIDLVTARRNNAILE